MRLIVISTSHDYDYTMVESSVVETPDDKPETVRAFLCLWLGQHANADDVWVFPDAARIAFDHEAEKRRMAEEAAERKRIADAEALAKNAEAARAARPVVRDQELEAERALTKSLRARFDVEQRDRERAAKIAKNWERSAEQLAHRLAKAQATLTKHGLTAEDPKSYEAQKAVAEHAELVLNPPADFEGDDS